ncbi:MAG: nitroreductase/quinone reductase family protein [Acidimicrobiia bacterium]|nr:nitroreductase/quinone reductase family protein [Acidimicrobiia bacterium]
MLSDSDIQALAAARTIDITTIGRRSGEPARIEIWWFHIDGEFVITGTPGPRDWYANLMADQTITVHTPLGDLTGRATPVTDDPTRRRVLSDPALSWYRSQAELDRLVAAAPMIRIRFD